MGADDLDFYTTVIHYVIMECEDCGLDEVIVAVKREW